MEEGEKICCVCFGIIAIIIWLIVDYHSFLYGLAGLFISLLIWGVISEILKKKKIEKEEKEREIERKREIEFEKKQNAKGLYKFENQWGTKKQIKIWKECKYGIDQNFMNMGHFEFEEFTAKLFRKMGYKAQVTPKTGDYGIDVIAEKDGEKIVIQCKQNSIGNNVSNRTVRDTLGAMLKIKADKSIIITTSDFTTQAKEQANGCAIELWDGKYLKRLIRKYFINSDEEDSDEEQGEEGDRNEDSDEEWEDLTDEDIENYKKKIMSHPDFPRGTVNFEQILKFIKKNFPNICEEVDGGGLETIAVEVLEGTEESE